MRHQFLLLPLAVALAWGLWHLLGAEQERSGSQPTLLPSPWLLVILLFELLSLLLIAAESRHFRAFGYFLPAKVAVACYGTSCLVWGSYVRFRRGLWLFWAALSTYLAGMAVALRGFPLNYLRSDMLPVISWADDRVLRHLNPYGTMRVGSRLYDFPYLPGMLVAFLPARAVHLDPRWATAAYLSGASALVFFNARTYRRTEVAALLAVFLLCPFLQYRHDLYLEPHWFAVVVAVVLMQRRHFVWSALAWGVGCAIYQLSWVIVPFFILNAFRRRGVSEAVKLSVITVLGALATAGPFLRSASHQVANNTVGQWSRLPHALADPINLSYWLTFVIRPDQLKWVQAVVMVSIFAFCALRNRCVDLTDTLRWMCWALAIFIPLNVIVDGYFYLTLLLLLLLFVCSANEWWREQAVQTLIGPRSTS